jgi:coiled-coil domain-containing protein 39
LTLKIEKLIEQHHKLKREVDNENLETNTLQIELDKTADEFRKAHAQRQDLIKQWENIIGLMQKRDVQIDQCAQVNRIEKVLFHIFNINLRFFL